MEQLARSAGKAKASHKAHQKHGENHEHVEHHEAHGHHDQEELRTFGFWIYLMTDVILFGTFFAAYIVLRGNTDGGPEPGQLFDLNMILVSTFTLLISSYTCGLALLAMNRQRLKAMLVWLGCTALLGALFLGLEIYEFTHLVHEGATIDRSAHWSAFYTLVGTHGIHVLIGLVWMISLMAQLARRGLTPVTRRKANIISLFWHFLDVVWIFVFTVVYLMGVS